MKKKLTVLVSIFFLGLSVNLFAQPSSAEIAEGLGNTYWEIQVGGQSYGFLSFYDDGTVSKESSEGGIESEGTWSVSDGKITLHFPDEGDAIDYTFTELAEDHIDVDFMGLAQRWILLEDDSEEE